MAKACGLGFPYNCEIVWLKCFTILSNSIAFVNQGLFCHHPASIKWDQMGFFITNVFLPNSYFHLIPLKSKPDYTWHTEQICNHVLNRQSLWILGATIKNYRILIQIIPLMIFCHVYQCALFELFWYWPISKAFRKRGSESGIRRQRSCRARGRCSRTSWWRNACTDRHNLQSCVVGT